MKNRWKKTQMPSPTRRGRDNNGERATRIIDEATNLSSGDMIHVLTARGYKVFPADRLIEIPNGWIVTATNVELSRRRAN